MIRLTIQSKVFLATLALAAAMTLLLIGLTRWSLESGFSRYVAEAEMARLDWLVERLENAYAEHGSWEFLRGNGPAWHQLHRNRPPMAGEGAPAGRLPEDGPPGGPPPREEERPGGKRPMPDVLGIQPRLAVLDANHEALIGNPQSAASGVSRPLRYQGQEVGRLALLPPRAPDSALDAAFLSTQTRNLWFAGLAGLALSLLAAWLLARHFLAPIRALAAAAKGIADGRAPARIPVRTSDELGELAADFNTMAEMLARVETSRRQWIADTSHELRTPIAVLRAEIEALQDGVRQADDATLARLHKQTMQLSKLVDDLRQSLDCLPENITLEESAIRPVEILAETVEEFRERYQAAGISLDAAGLANGGWTLRGDAARWHQVFANLLENTLRYTTPGGQLRLRARAAHGWLSLEFDDTPPAPPGEAMPRLFERFFRAEPSRSRAYGGSGLGLSICKALVEAHGGAISAGNSELGGLAVRIRLPLEP